jgi:hypothetical protein
MPAILSPFTPIVLYIQTNFVQIIGALVIATISVFAFSVTVSTLKNMKSDIFSYYPFDRFFPHSGRWSIFYFFMLIIFLAGLIYFFAKGGFYLNPA